MPGEASPPRTRLSHLSPRVSPPPRAPARPSSSPPHLHTQVAEDSIPSSEASEALALPIGALSILVVLLGFLLWQQHILSRRRMRHGVLDPPGWGPGRKEHQSMAGWSAASPPSSFKRRDGGSPRVYGHSGSNLLAHGGGAASSSDSDFSGRQNEPTQEAKLSHAVLSRCAEMDGCDGDSCSHGSSSGGGTSRGSPQPSSATSYRGVVMPSASSPQATHTTNF